MKTVVILLSRSGGGKGTQAGLLKEYFGEARTLHVATGEVLRKVTRRPGLFSGKLMQKKVMDAGEKAPDFSAIWAWGGKLIEHFNESVEAIIFDGSPRTKLEAKALDEALTFYEIKKVFPLLIEVTPKEAMARMLKRKRNDDTKERIARRLAYYEAAVKPAIEYYRRESQHKLIIIDGMVPPDKVFAQIKRAVQ